MSVISEKSSIAVWTIRGSTSETVDTVSDSLGCISSKKRCTTGGTMQSIKYMGEKLEMAWLCCDETKMAVFSDNAEIALMPFSCLGEKTN